MEGFLSPPLLWHLTTNGREWDDDGGASIDPEGGHPLEKTRGNTVILSEEHAIIVCVAFVYGLELRPVDYVSTAERDHKYGGREEEGDAEGATGARVVVELINTFPPPPPTFPAKKIGGGHWTEKSRRLQSFVGGISAIYTFKRRCAPLRTWRTRRHSA